MKARSVAAGIFGPFWLALSALAAETPTSGVTCGVAYGWMNNSLPVPQDPCLVAAYLEGNCGTGYWNIPALPTGQTYNGPNVNQTNVCLCSTVVYNAVSACDACQDESWITWPNWKLNCDPSVITVGSYLVDIPQDTAVPKWMYQDPTKNIGNTFNVSLAKLTAGLHDADITAANQASTIPSKPKSKASIGAIVGGVIGGLAFIVIAALIGWLLYQRRLRSRASSAPSKRYVNEWSKGVIGGAPPPPSRMGNGNAPTSYGGSTFGDDPSKESSGMMLMNNMSPHEIPYGQPNTMAYPYPASPPGGSTTLRPSMESRRMSPPNYGGGYSQSQMGSSRATHGHHQRDTSNSSGGKGLKGFFGSSPPQSNAITPFILPPLGSPPPPPESMDHSSSNRSQSAGRGGGRGTPFSMSNDTSISPPPSMPTSLPSRIEYLGDRRPPAGMSNPTVPPSSYPVTSSSSANASRSSLGNTRPPQSAISSVPGYYNPDDPSTYPIGGEYYLPQQHQSNEGTALGSSTFMPQTPADKLPRGGIVHNQQSPTSPTGYTWGPRSAGGASSRNPPPLNMDVNMGGSVHTLPYNHSASPARGGGGAAGAAVLPDGQWTPHVPASEADREFDPYRRA